MKRISIDSTSEEFNKYHLYKKGENKKNYSDGYNERELPYQTQVNELLRKIGVKKP